MSSNTPTISMSSLLLSLPSEIRLNIYHKSFQSTNVTIHRGRTMLGRHADCPRTPKKCLDLLCVNKLIRQEATSLFFKETMFMIPGCSCWFPSAFTNFVLPVDMQNVTIQSIQDGNDPATHVREAVAAVEDRFARTNSMISFLVCEPVLEEHSMFSKWTIGTISEKCHTNASNSPWNQEYVLWSTTDGPVFEIQSPFDL